MAKELPITEFDLRTVDESTQMFKAMIPFLDYQLQKPLSLIIRMNEFSQTLRFYNRSPGNPAIRGQSSHAYINSINDIFTNDDFLNTVMPYCPEKYAAMIEQFRSFSKVSEMMNLFQSFDDGADLFNNPIILNMMNQTVNTTNNTANPKNFKDGNIPGKTQVVSTEIYTFVEAMEYDKAHWLAGGMLVFSFAVLLALSFLNRRAKAVSV